MKFKLKSKRIKEIFRSKVHILCLTNVNNKRFTNQLKVYHTKKNANVLVIVDIDKFRNESDFTLFMENLTDLVKHKNTKTLTLIMQETLEFELSSSLDISIQDLYKIFKVKSKSEFTSTFLKTNDTSLYNKLKQLENTDIWSNKYIRLPDNQIKEITTLIQFDNVSVFK